METGVHAGPGAAAAERTIVARDLRALEEELRRAKERFGLPAAVRVVSCYEAGRDGFWHRSLVAQGIANHVVEWPHGPTGFREGLADPRGKAYVTTLTVDGLRWFDHWLRGIDNGILREPPVTYAVMEQPREWSWRHEAGWLPKATRTLLFLAGGPSGSVKSANDGLLTLDRSRLELTGKDRWTVDYTTTTGTTNRFMAASGSKMDYGDLAPNDTKGLTYTTAPLEADLVVVGHPVVTLYASSTAPDGDLPILDPAPGVTIFRSPRYPSRIELPIP